MGVGDREIRIQSSYEPQIRGGSISITLDPESFRNLGVDPLSEPEKIPDQIQQEFVKRGRREGEIIIDLKAHLEEDNGGQ